MGAQETRCRPVEGRLVLERESRVELILDKLNRIAKSYHLGRRMLFPSGVISFSRYLVRRRDFGDRERELIPRTLCLKLMKALCVQMRMRYKLTSVRKGFVVGYRPVMLLASLGALVPAAALTEV